MGKTNVGVGLYDKIMIENKKGKISLNRIEMLHKSPPKRSFTMEFTAC